VYKRQVGIKATTMEGLVPMAISCQAVALIEESA